MNKSTIKKIVFSDLFQNIFSYKGLNNLAFKNSTVIFLYHEVSDKPSRFHLTYNLNVPPDIFKKQIELISSIFNIISSDQFLTRNYKTPSAMITFDDGTAGYFENAVPIMSEHRCPSLVFLNMGPINGEIFWSGMITYLCECDNRFIKMMLGDKEDSNKEAFFLNLRPENVNSYIEQNDKFNLYHQAKDFYGRFANRNHLEACKDNRLVKFGNHLYNHFNCGVCTEEEIVESYKKNQEEIEKFPNATKFFSYPFGQKGTCYNKKTNRLLQNLGAKAIFSAHPEDFKGRGRLFHRFPMTKDIVSEKQLRTKLFYTKVKQIISVE